MNFTPYDRPVRAAFVGLGRIYDLNVRAYLDNPDVEVVALVDPSEERRANAARTGRRHGRSPRAPRWPPAAWRYAMASDMLQRLTPDYADKDACIAAYEAHNEAVRRAVPPDRFLEWTPSDGWGPMLRRRLALRPQRLGGRPPTSRSRTSTRPTRYRAHRPGSTEPTSSAAGTKSPATRRPA